jgi:quinol monooxygenase YgiN
MEHSHQPYTLGIWKVKPGNEQAFISEWQALATWTEEHFSSGGKGYLLQDTHNPQFFISFGSWKDAQTIASWRATLEFQAFVAKAKLWCEEWQPHSMNLVAVSRD